MARREPIPPTLESTACTLRPSPVSAAGVAPVAGEGVRGQEAVALATVGQRGVLQTPATSEPATPWRHLCLHE